MIPISKSKPDVVHVHRIELQKKERELIESAVTAYNFKKYADPFVAGFSDVSFLLAVGTLLTLWFPDIILPTGEAQSGAVIDAIRAGIRQGYDRAAEERELTGAATLDESTGVRDFLGNLWYNLANPNWNFSGENRINPIDPDSWASAVEEGS